MFAGKNAAPWAIAIVFRRSPLSIAHGRTRRRSAPPVAMRSHLKSPARAIAALAPKIHIGSKKVL